MYSIIISSIVFVYSVKASEGVGDSRNNHKMSIRSAAYAALVIATIALVLGIAGLAVAVNKQDTIITTTPRPPLNTGGSFAPRVYLALRDNRVQSLDGLDTWTNVGFNSDMVNSGSWLHESDTVIRANSSGQFVVYFSIQAQLKNGVSTESTCKVCNLRYSIRGTQQFAGVGGIFEIPASLTYESGQGGFLSKQFIIQASRGDLFRFQFHSKCSTLQLQPYPYVVDVLPVPSSTTFPVSATLLIS